jgi:hypothetical protein
MPSGHFRAPIATEAPMKRMACDHPKILRFSALLDVPYYSAVGLLELLWHFTARHAIRGDVGKWSDAEIASGIRWPAEYAKRLIDALIEARLLDRHKGHRLVIHDWRDHADESTKKTLQKHLMTFAENDPEPEDEPAVEVDTAPVLDHSGIVLDQSPNGSDSLSLSLCRSQSHTNAPAAPSPPLKGKKRSKQTNPYPEAFTLWWVTYPRRAAKAEALKAWEAAVKLIAAERPCTEDQAQESLLEAAQAFAASPKGKSGAYCPYPATWLNQGRYDDDRTTWKDSQNGNDRNGKPSDARVRERDYGAGLRVVSNAPARA